VPTGYYAKCVLIHVCNTSPSKHISFSWYDASTATTLDILTNYDLTSKQYLQFDGNAYIVLEEGDRIQITTQSASTFSFIATFEVQGAQRT
jgi:hypothetical protein